MKLYFEDSYGRTRLIGHCKNEEEVHNQINAFIDKCNHARPKDKKFKVYYIRSWKENDKTWYDVGSWSEFFFTTHN